MKHSTRMKNISTLIKRLREGVTEPEFTVHRARLFGGAMRGQECGDIDVVIEGRENKPYIYDTSIYYCDSPANKIISLRRLRAGMKRIECHPVHDLDGFTGTPSMVLYERAA